MLAGISAYVFSTVWRGQKRAISRLNELGRANIRFACRFMGGNPFTFIGLPAVPPIGIRV